MHGIFSDRITDVPRSFIREILKVTVDESIISFAGGLPNRDLFPVNEIKTATNKVLDLFGSDVLQYSSSEGFLGLREWIAKRYKTKKNIDVDPDDILITAGSQQGLDLLGKTILNDGDDVVIEEPGYLGAIQAFSLYKPTFHPIPLENDGVDIKKFEKAVRNHNIKLFYCVPNFHNPAGISYTLEKRKAIADIVRGTNTIIIEDDPYGELRFLGSEQPSFYKIIPENTVLLGSFSKIVVPSFRIGWIVARKEVMEKLIIAKQASDLHTNYFGQRIIHQLLTDYSIDDHIETIRKAYGSQRDVMVEAIEAYFPKDIQYTKPEGGMFLWVTLPEGVSAVQVFNEAIARKVAFVPGDPFYINKKGVNTLRLNFSCTNEDMTRQGIQRLGEVITSRLI
ncbi:aminotransferase class I/II-fold pyridoxal phosphate-dependent enzyme [Heliobacillus mobilis]|uniref:Aminotransferase class I/II-fold pyridoxal phosphate-dependent enzyme n=1 Tax=Heliobacterium mobile TaxID=28064 RepID=A0A6I3SIC7_HELMO|nr:PLP-dependent aminotransferase family protein [Heliobacterium mobile]MTV48535.1 aminotransferase class I/II-fold pyridoxal phosphate-dependent enzyme [Heliobacterium mobile]